MSDNEVMFLKTHMLFSFFNNSLKLFYMNLLQGDHKFFEKKTKQTNKMDMHMESFKKSREKTCVKNAISMLQCIW